MNDGEGLDQEEPGGGRGYCGHRNPSKRRKATGGARGRPSRNKRGGGRAPVSNSSLAMGSEHQSATSDIESGAPRLLRGLGGGFSRAAGAVEEEVKKVGRPPLNEMNGKMDPEALKERKRQLGKENYQQKKINKLRKEAVEKRRDRRDCHQAGDVGGGVDGGHADAGEADAREADGGDDSVGDSGEDSGEVGGEGSCAGEAADVSEEDGDVGRKKLHSRTEARRRSTFFQMLPTSSANQVEVLKKLVEDFSVEELVVQNSEVDELSSERFSDRWIFHYRSKIREYLVLCESESDLHPADLLLLWAQKLACMEGEMFFKCGIEFADPSDVPKEIRIRKISDKVSADLLLNRRNPDCRKVSLKLAEEVAKQAELHHQKCDIGALKRALCCSH